MPFEDSEFKFPDEVEAKGKKEEEWRAENREEGNGDEK